jgi:hypothetical protein
MYKWTPCHTAHIDHWLNPFSLVWRFENQHDSCLTTTIGINWLISNTKHVMHIILEGSACQQIGWALIITSSG